MAYLPSPGLPTMKYQSVKKKKKKAPCDEDLGVNFQHGAWGFSCGTPITCNGNPAASFHAYCMETAPFHGYTILVLKLRPLSQSKAVFQKHLTTQRGPGACVFVFMCMRKRERENAFLLSAGAPFKTSSIKT